MTMVQSKGGLGYTASLTEQVYDSRTWSVSSGASVDFAGLSAMGTRTNLECANNTLHGHAMSQQIVNCEFMVNRKCIGPM